MLRKPFFASILCAIVFCGTTERCFADTAAQLQQAGKYQRNGYLSQAEQLYKQIVQNNAGSEEAFKAQTELVKVYILLLEHEQKDADAKARAALSKLTTDFAGNPGLAKSLYAAAGQYKKFCKWDRAKAVHGQIIQQYPTSAEAGKSQVDIPKVDIMALIKAGRGKVAQKTIDTLIAEHSGNSHLAKALRDVAYFWRRFKNYTKAAELYQYVADTWPNDTGAVWAQMGVAKTCVESGDAAGAQREISELVTRFSGHPDLAGALRLVAVRYWKEKKYTESKNLYQQIIDNYSDADETEKAHLAIAKINILSRIDSGNLTGMDAAVDKLIADFSSNMGLPMAMVHVAWAYEKQQKYDKAIAIYNKIIEQHPNNFRSAKSRMEIGKCQGFAAIEAGNAGEVVAIANGLISNFSKNPYLGEQLLKIARNCSKKVSQLQDQGLKQQATRLTRAAATMCKNFVSQVPDSFAAAQVCARAARYYRDLGEYAKSNQLYQKVVDDYPGYGKGWDAQFQIGRNCEKMGKTGLVSKAEAKTLSRAAYEQLLARYPDCKAARHAQRWLAR